MKNCAVGVFDSGMGGLALVNELNNLIPDENIIYIADKIQVTDLIKDKETVLQYAEKNIGFLERHDVKMIISACGDVNTLFGVKPPETQTEYSGIFLPAAQAACGATKNNKVGIIGSSSIIKRGGYAKIIKNIKPGTLVTGVACPLLSNIIESGLTGKESNSLSQAAEKYFTVLKQEKVDTVILADGHYAVIKNIISDILGDTVTLISPYEETAKHVYNCLLESDMLSDEGLPAQNKIYLTFDSDLYYRISPFFLKRKNNIFEKVNL